MMQTFADRARLLAQLKRHEAYRRRPYYDTKGYLTVGYGRNLETVGLSQEESTYLLSNDVDAAVRCLVVYAWFPRLEPARQAALANLMVNVGPKSFATFTRMIAALERGDFVAAAAEMLDSKWRTDVGDDRATEVSNQLRAGVWA